MHTAFRNNIECYESIERVRKIDKDLKNIIIYKH